MGANTALSLKKYLTKLLIDFYKILYRNFIFLNALFKSADTHVNIQLTYLVIASHKYITTQ